MNYIQLNKFSELHDERRIFFCKTDYLIQDFEKIKNINNEVILITGNSDYPITEEEFIKKPKNIKLWFAQNAIHKDESLIPIPIGLENKIESARSGHGVGHTLVASEKEALLARSKNVIPTKKVYSNFNLRTNWSHRSFLYDFVENIDYIDRADHNLQLKDFFDKILEYQMVLCPVGNGIDTHRLWEVLYSNRIPIVIKMGDYGMYEMYKNFPIVMLDSVEDLKNLELLENLHEKEKNKNWNSNLLSFEYWKKLVLNSI